MPWLAIVLTVVVLLVFVFTLRGRPANFLPWINFGQGTARAPDKAAMQLLEDEATELARDRPPKDLAP